MWQNQTQSTEEKIRRDFEQLREFLEREEAERLAALEQEDVEKRELVKKKADCITRDILAFSHAVIAIENEIASSDCVFLRVNSFISFLLQVQMDIEHFVILLCSFRTTPTQKKGRMVENFCGRNVTTYQDLTGPCTSFVVPQSAAAREGSRKCVGRSHKRGQACEFSQVPRVGEDGGAGSVQ